MKVLSINTADTVGGAASVASEIMDGVEKNYGVETLFIVSEKYSDKNNVFSSRGKMLWFAEKSFSRIASLVGLQYLKVPFSSENILKKAEDFRPDIIHIHNFHGGYADYGLLGNLSDIAPIVWTFHDMFPFTGHCAYSFDCEKWKTGCGKCPGISIPPSLKFDTTSFLWRYKKKVLQSLNFKIIVPSKWLYDCVKDSFLSEKDMQLIYNGIDTVSFAGCEKNKARKKLSLPEDKKILLFNANGGLKNPFKGGEYIYGVYEHFKKDENLLFINVGGEKKECNCENWMDYGFVSDRQKMFELYSASDVFVFPTLAETFGLVVVEAMLCGLPAVAFKTGGVVELVEHMKTGYLAEHRNLSDLIKGVDTVLNNESLTSEFSIKSIKKVEEIFSSVDMVKHYFDVYEELSKKSRRKK
ncbi:MAG: glycosyltransferase [bacterium]